MTKTTQKKIQREIDEFTKLFALYEVFFVRATKKLRERDDYETVSKPLFLVHEHLRQLIREANGETTTYSTNDHTNTAYVGQTRAD